jgi:hypothetical protein
MSDDPFTFLDKKPTAPVAAPISGDAPDPFAFLEPPASASTDRLEAVAPYSGTDAIVHGMTLGLNEPLRALATAGSRYLRGATPEFDYQQPMKEIQRGRDMYAVNNPISNFVNNLGGGVAGGGIATLGAKAATVAPTALGSLGQILKGAATGAGMGGIMGAADNATSIGEAAPAALHGAEMGAALGGAIPAGLAAVPAASRVARGLLNPSGPAADEAAIAALAARQSRSQAGGGPSIAQMSSQLNQAETPLTIADVAGKPVRNYLGSLARSDTPAAQVVESALVGRDQGMGDRLINVINRDISSSPSAFDATQALTQAQKTNSAPLYEKALNSGPLYSDRLQQFLDNPRVQTGINKGVRIERDNALAEGRAFNPNDYAIVNFNSAGDPIIGPVPNMRLLDTAKQGLDDMLEPYRNAVTGHLQLDGEGRAINNVRKSFIKELDSLNPDYAAARQAFAGPAQVKDAIAQGRDFSSYEPEQIKSLVSSLNPSEKEGYLLGAAQSLRNKVNDTSLGGNESLKIGYSTGSQQRLRQLFDSDAQFAQFMKPIEEERLGARTKYSVMGNSLSGERVAADVANNPVMSMGGGVGPAVVGAVAGGNPVAGFGIAAAKSLANILGSHLMGQTPQAQTAAAQMLTSTDPAYRQLVLNQMLGAAQPAGRYISPLSGLLAGTHSSMRPALNLIVPNADQGGR